MIVPEGRYTGTIQSAGLETDPYDEDGMVLTFEVLLPDGNVVSPRHSTGGQYGRITKQIVEGLGLEWPYGIERIPSLMGKEVPVTVKHKTSKSGEVYAKSYIATAKKGEPMEAAGVKKMMDKLAGVDPDSVPF